MTDLEVTVSENLAEGSDVTKSHTIEPPMAMGHSVTIEYKPVDRTIETGELGEYIEQTLNEQDQLDEAVDTIYHEIAAELFPGYSGYDELWSKIPLVVSAKREHFSEKTTATLGRFN